jgi:hypothetical protein
MNDTRRGREIRHMLDMRHAATTGDWATLLRELRDAGKPQGYSPQAWTGAWKPIYAARLLATQPQETVTLVIQDLDSLKGEAAQAPNWHDLALGMLGTNRSVSKLRERAGTLPAKEQLSYDLPLHPAGAAFVSFVTYAGSDGHRLLQELATAPQTKPSLRRALAEWQKKTLPTEIKEITFPPARQDAQLPLTADAALGMEKKPG